MRKAPVLEIDMSSSSPGDIIRDLSKWTLSSLKFKFFLFCGIFQQRICSS